MNRARILLLFPTTTYRASAFLTAAKKLDIEVVVGLDHRQALTDLVSGSSLSLNFNKPELAVQKIVRFAREHPFTAIIGVEEETVLLAALAAQALDLSYNPIPAVMAARYKHLMRQRLVLGGLNSPGYRLLSIRENPLDMSQAINYPCVLKPTFLSASRGVIRANNIEEFNQAFQRIVSIITQPDVVRKGGEYAQHILVEDYIPGSEVSVEGLLTNGKFKPLALFDKPDPLKGPYFAETIYLTPSRLPQAYQQKIIHETERAAAALGLTDGPVHAELRINDQGIWPVEIAARSIGGLCARVLRFNGNVSLEELILLQALGRDVRYLERESSAAGVMMLPVFLKGVLKEVRHIHLARLIPAIEDVVITIARGTVVKPLPEGDRYLGFLFARGKSPDVAENALRTAYNTLEVKIVEEVKVPQN